MLVVTTSHYGDAKADQLQHMFSLSDKNEDNKSSDIHPGCEGLGGVLGRIDNNRNHRNMTWSQLSSLLRRGEAGIHC